MNSLIAIQVLEALNICMESRRWDRRRNSPPSAPSSVSP